MLINVVNEIVIALGFAASLSRSVDVLSDRTVGVLVDMLDGVLTVVVIGGLPGIGVDALVDVNANVFAGVMSVEFVTPSPLEGFSC